MEAVVMTDYSDALQWIAILVFIVGLLLLALQIRSWHDEWKLQDELLEWVRR